MIEVSEVPTGIDLTLSRGPGQTLQIRLSWNEAATLLHELLKQYDAKPVIEAAIPDD